MYCKDCKFRQPLSGGYFHPYCSNEKLAEDDYHVTYKTGGDRLIYSYSEGGTFCVEDNFGCVHFEHRDTDKVKSTTDGGTLTFEELQIACKNIGVNLECGGCATAFYTGTHAPHDENCFRK